MVAVKRGTEPNSESQDKLNVFDTWCATYTNVNESSKLFSKISELQVGITLLIVSVLLQTYYFLVFAFKTLFSYYLDPNYAFCYRGLLHGFPILTDVNER